MKLFKYGLPLAALAVLASCSNDTIDAPGNDVQKTPVEGAKYATIKINFAGNQGTKAVDSYENGDDSKEWRATSGVIAIFDGSEGGDEDDFTCIEVSPLTSLAWKDSDQEVVTTSSTTATAQFSSLESLDDLYALVILNCPSDDFRPDVNKTFGEWKLKDLDITEDGLKNMVVLGQFTMSNAPDSDNDGMTLVEIPEDAFKLSIGELDPDEAPEVYVQRVVAKVTLSDQIKEEYTVQYATDSEGDGYDTDDTVIFTDWGLNYTNKVTYPVQVVLNSNVEDDWTSWESIGSHMQDYSGEFNRIWWGLDPNYDGEDSTYYSSNDDEETEDSEVVCPFNVITTDDLKAIGKKDSDINVEYPLENTMSYNNMTRLQTTTVILKATYYVDENFDFNDYFNVDDFDDDTVYDWERPDREAKNPKPESVISYGLLRIPVPQNFAKLVGKSYTKTPLSEIFKSEDGKNTKQYENALVAIKKLLGVSQDQDPVVNYYFEGVCYYAIPIRHFDNDETELDRDAWRAANYKYDEDMTGRFGVLRNNWYEVNVRSVSNIGEPEIPTPDPNDPDDPKDNYYLNAQIHILKWAKRNFNYDL